MKFVFILCNVISFSAFGVDIPLDSVRSEQRKDGLFVIHRVEQQETLFGLSQRYKSSVGSIVKINNLQGNEIDIGQELSILFNERELGSDRVQANLEGMHRIMAGETLYSISKRYGMEVKELLTLNKLGDDEISPGQYLKVSKQELVALDTLKTTPIDTVVSADTLTMVRVDENRVPDGFSPYLVQTGETLLSIARKKGVKLDMLKEWNELTSDYLRIGQKLIIKDSLEFETSSDSLEFFTKLDENGFEREFKVGIAAVISNISTAKYLALHRELTIGTELKVRNLMNNRVVHVKVVGRLPDTGINRNVLVRLSQPAFDQLGILDPKSRVEVSHYKK